MNLRSASNGAALGNRTGKGAAHAARIDIRTAVSAAANGARKCRRFSFTSLLRRGSRLRGSRLRLSHLGVNRTLLVRLFFVIQPVIDTRQAVVRNRGLGIQLDTRFDLLGGLCKRSPALVGESELEVRLPATGVELDRMLQQFFN